jgi:Cyclin
MAEATRADPAAVLPRGAESGNPPSGRAGGIGEALTGEPAAGGPAAGEALRTGAGLVAGDHHQAVAPITRGALAVCLARCVHDDFCVGAASQVVPGPGVHPDSFSFQSESVPRIALPDYLARLVLYLDPDGETLLLAAINLYRCCTAVPTLPVNVLTIHRLLLTHLLVATKVHQDSSYASGLNARFARVGGVVNSEMNLLETRMVRMLDYRVHVAPELYSTVHSTLAKLIAGSPTAAVVGVLPALVKRRHPPPTRLPVLIDIPERPDVPSARSPAWADHKYSPAHARPSRTHTEEARAKEADVPGREPAADQWRPPVETPAPPNHGHALARDAPQGVDLADEATGVILAANQTAGAAALGDAAADDVVVESDAANQTAGAAALGDAAADDVVVESKAASLAVPTPGAAAPVSVVAARRARAYAHAAEGDGAGDSALLAAASHITAQVCWDSAARGASQSRRERVEAGEDGRTRGLGEFARPFPRAGDDGDTPTRHGLQPLVLPAGLVPKEQAALAASLGPLKRASLAAGSALAETAGAGLAAAWCWTPWQNHALREQLALALDETALVAGGFSSLVASPPPPTTRHRA